MLVSVAHLKRRRSRAVPGRPGRRRRYRSRCVAGGPETTSRTRFSTTRPRLAIATGTAPFTGSFKPEAPLSVLNGTLSNGTWIAQGQGLGDGHDRNDQLVAAAVDLSGARLQRALRPRGHALCGRQRAAAAGRTPSSIRVKICRSRCRSSTPETGPSPAPSGPFRRRRPTWSFSTARRATAHSASGASAPAMVRSWSASGAPCPAAR